MTPLEELALLLRPAGGGLYLVSTGKAEQSALMRRYYAADTDQDITHEFLGDLSRIAQAKVVLLGIPSDVGAGFRRGANLGPQAIRERLLADQPSFLEDCAARGILDIGDVFVVPQLLHDDMLAQGQIERSQDALYPDAPEALRRRLPVSPLSIAERALELVLRINPAVKPLMLGGDHSTAWPIVKAMHQAGRRFGILQLDAHTDLLPERLGIPLCFATWSYHANELIGRAGRLVQVGIRATRHPRQHWEDSLGVRQFWPADNVSDEHFLQQILRAVEVTGLPMYLSNDIDGTDSAEADATGTPEPKGLKAAFVRELIARLADRTQLVGADLVEVAPLLGEHHGTDTLGVAAEYVRVTLDGTVAQLQVVEALISRPRGADVRRVSTRCERPFSNPRRSSWHRQQPRRRSPIPLSWAFHFPLASPYRRPSRWVPPGRSFGIDLVHAVQQKREETKAAPARNPRTPRWPRAVLRPPRV